MARPGQVDDSGADDRDGILRSQWERIRRGPVGEVDVPDCLPVRVGHIGSEEPDAPVGDPHETEMGHGAPTRSNPESGVPSSTVAGLW